MKKNFFILTILIFLSPIFLNGQNNSWNNLMPLRSTRADVEKLLGKPQENNYNFCCDYEPEKGRVSIKYSTYKCEDGWNVPTNTVLSIYAEPPKDLFGKSAEALRLDRNKFSVTNDDAMHGYWTNSEDGIRYHFSNVSMSLESITYIPKKSDNNLRCDGFPPYSPETQYFTMHTARFYNPRVKAKENFFEIVAQFDSLIIDLIQNDPNEIRAYVLVYFDNKLPLAEYRKRLNKIKTFVFKRHKITPDKVIIIEGGMKEESKIEFYLLPKELKPPTPNPTFPSPQFMKKR